MDKYIKIYASLNYIYYNYLCSATKLSESLLNT